MLDMILTRYASKSTFDMQKDQQSIVLVLETGLSNSYPNWREVIFDRNITLYKKIPTSIWVMK